MRNLLTIFALLITLAIGSLVSMPNAGAQGFVDRILRPCSSGLAGRASVITNPNNTGNVTIITCTGGVVTINGVTVVPGGGTINPTNTFIPYRSAAATFSDSPLARASAALVTTSAVIAPSAAGGVAVGSNALPFSSVFIGAAATNNIQITGTATSAKVATFPDLTGTVAMTSQLTTINNTDNVMPYRSSATAFSDSPITRTSATVLTSTAALRVPDGTAAIPTLASASVTNTGIYFDSGQIRFTQAGTNYLRSFAGIGMTITSAAASVGYGLEPTVNAGADVNLGRAGVGLFEINSSVAGTLRDLTARNLKGISFSTNTNCADNAGAAACGAAAAGSVVVDAGATTVVVSTTAVTANSQIFVQYDSSLGARLSVTCNVTPAEPAVTARTAATSFTITIPAAPVTNPACYSYFIVN